MMLIVLSSSIESANFVVDWYSSNHHKTAYNSLNLNDVTNLENQKSAIRNAEICIKRNHFEEDVDLLFWVIRKRAFKFIRMSMTNVVCLTDFLQRRITWFLNIYSLRIFRSVFQNRVWRAFTENTYPHLRIPVSIKHHLQIP